MFERRETAGRIFVVAVSVVGIAPSRKALSTNALVAPAFGPSVAMLWASYSAFFRARKFCHCAYTLALMLRSISHRMQSALMSAR